MQNPFFQMHCRWSDFWEAMVPGKPRYGNFYLRGKNGRYRKLLQKAILKTVVITPCLLFLLVSKIGHAQAFELPDMAFLKSSIDSFFSRKAEAEILEFKETTKGRWLNYIPIPGYSPFAGKWTFSFNIAAPVQEARARNQNKSRVAALRRSNLLQAEATEQECLRDLEALKMAVKAFDAGSTVDSLQEQLFQIAMQQYKRQEMTPTEMLNRKQSHEAHKLARLTQAQQIRNGIFAILTKSHAPAWAFEKVQELASK